jgi:acyl carrier protein
MKTIDIVTEIFRDILDEEDLVLAPETTAEDVEAWDSLTHVQLMVAIEKRFGIKFTSREISGFQNVGELLAAIENKL